MTKITEYAELNYKLNNQNCPMFTDYLTMKNKTREEIEIKYEIDFNNYLSLCEKRDLLRVNIENDKQAVLLYWNHILDEYKYYPRHKMIWKLADKMRLCYYKGIYEYNQNDYNYSDILAFADSKRPYGNKDIPASILASLGVDKFDVLQLAGVPEEIQEWCMKLHEEVKLFLIFK